MNLPKQHKKLPEAFSENFGILQGKLQLMLMQTKKIASYK